MTGRIEIIARTERRRKYSAAQKAAILTEADQEGVTVRQVAERHEIAESLIYNWRSARRQAFAIAARRQRRWSTAVWSSSGSTTAAAWHWRSADRRSSPPLAHPSYPTS